MESRNSRLVSLVSIPGKVLSQLTKMVCEHLEKKRCPRVGLLKPSHGKLPSLPLLVVTLDFNKIFHEAAYDNQRKSFFSPGTKKPSW